MKTDADTHSKQELSDHKQKKTRREILVVKATDPTGENNPFLDRLDEEDREALIDYFPIQAYARGSVIFREGELGQALYIIWSGRVAILKEETNAMFTLLAYRNPGDIVGEMGVIGDRPRSASVIAVEDTELIKINSRAFHQLVQEHPNINMTVLEVLSDRLRAADEARTDIAQVSHMLSHQVITLTEQREHLTSLTQMHKDSVDLIVHDLRNPAGIVKTSLDFLEGVLGQGDLDYQRQILELAQQSTDRLLTMIESMLDAARQEQQGVSLKKKPTSVEAMVQAPLENARATAATHNLTLAQEVESSLPTLDLDADKIGRVITNLLDNAINYTPDGGAITLTVKIEDEQVVISVTDTGPGVPPEHRERIFERFGQAPETRGRKRGFGLGLYFCREVVQAHGGRIWVEPGPDGVGSRFTFTLPQMTT
jgi:signal transduction histidine kinase